MALKTYIATRGFYRQGVYYPPGSPVTLDESEKSKTFIEATSSTPAPAPEMPVAVAAPVVDLPPPARRK